MNKYTSKNTSIREYVLTNMQTYMHTVMLYDTLP